MESKSKIYNTNLVGKNAKSIKGSTYEFAVNLTENNEKVLDVGCATGFLGEYLYLKKNCEVIGCDFSCEELEMAEKRNSYEKLFRTDLNNIADEFDLYEKYFDKIILLDVLEHLNNPENVLRKLSKLTNKNGKIIISVPNISHQSVKFSLLVNEFEYQNYGILDSTHVKFFTLKSFVKLLSSNGFEITNFDIRYSNQVKAFDKINLDVIPGSVKRYVLNSPHSREFQYLFEIKKSALLSEEIIDKNLDFVSKISKKHKRDRIINNKIGVKFIELLCSIIPFERLRNKIKRCTD